MTTMITMTMTMKTMTIMVLEISCGPQEISKTNKIPKQKDAQ